MQGHRRPGLRTLSLQGFDLLGFERRVSDWLAFVLPLFDLIDR
jgi:hypothetical protein